MTGKDNHNKEDKQRMQESGDISATGQMGKNNIHR